MWLEGYGFLDPYFHFMTFMSATNKIYFFISESETQRITHSHTSFYYNSRQQLKNIQGSHRNFFFFFHHMSTRDGLRQKIRQPWREWGGGKKESE